MVISRRQVMKCWVFFLAISIVSRCLPTMIYRSILVEYLIVFGLAGMAVFCTIPNVGKIDFHFVDAMWLLTLPWILSGDGSIKYLLFTSLGLLCYYLIQSDLCVITALRYPLLVFAVFTSVITWISFVAPNFYMERILSVFPEGDALGISFLHRNMYHGFTNHYSRNAVYIILGLFALLCEFMVGKKSKIWEYALAVFLFCTLLLVAKRGPTIFFVLTIMIVQMVKGSDFFSKIKKLAKYTGVAVLAFSISFVLIPGTRNLVVRFLMPNRSGDISSGRFFLYGIAWDMFLKNPVAGNGWGSFLSEMAGTTFQGAHNDYLQLLAETGLVGFLAYTVPSIVVLFCTIRAYKGHDWNIEKSVLPKSNMLFSMVYQIFFLLYAMVGLPHYSYEQYTLYLIVCGFGMGSYKHVLKQETFNR